MPSANVPAVLGGCPCGHRMVEHYANGCGWCICKVSGPAIDEALTLPETPPLPTVDKGVRPCARKGCGRPMAEHEYGEFCP